MRNIANFEKMRVTAKTETIFRSPYHPYPTLIPLMAPPCWFLVLKAGWEKGRQGENMLIWGCCCGANTTRMPLPYHY
jgi:hypothetical protein